MNPLKINPKNTVIALVMMLSTQQVFAWGEMGHKMVGGIAESLLTDDAKAMVRSIVGIEGLYISAIWPDLVRDDARFSTKDEKANAYDFSPYHFCEIPVGQTYDPKKVERDCQAVMTYTVNILKDPKALRETRMLALRYLVHVVGDIHQPFHVGNGYDRGANACKIKFQRNDNARPYITNLHSFWDGTLVDLLQESYNSDSKKGGSQVRFYGEFIKVFLDKNKDAFNSANRGRVEQGTIFDWMQESADLRESSYPDAAGSMKGVPKGEEYKHRSYCQWYANQNDPNSMITPAQIDENKIPVLSDDYITESKDTVNSQWIKGGIRLAKLLNQAAAENRRQGSLGLSTKDEDNILKDFLTKVKNLLN